MHSTCRRCTYTWASLKSTSSSPFYHVSPVASLCRNWLCGVMHQVCSQGVRHTLVYVHSYTHTNVTRLNIPHLSHAYKVIVCMQFQPIDTNHTCYVPCSCMQEQHMKTRYTIFSYYHINTSSVTHTCTYTHTHTHTHTRTHTHTHTHTHIMWCDASGVFSGCATHTCILNCTLTITHTHTNTPHGRGFRHMPTRQVRKTCWFLPSCMHSQGIQSVSGCLSHVRKVIHCIQ